MKEGKKDKALKLLQKVEKEFPSTTVPHSWMSGSTELARTWLALGQNKKCAEICEDIASTTCEYLEWYVTRPTRYAKNSMSEIRSNLYTLQELLDMFEVVSPKRYEFYDKKMELYYGIYVGLNESR